MEKQRNNLQISHNEYQNNNNTEQDNVIDGFDSSQLNKLYEEFINHRKYQWPIDKQLQAELELLDINLKHKMPLEAFGSIMSWAKKFFPSDIKIEEEKLFLMILRND